MSEARQSLISRPIEVIRKPGFWIILIIFVLLTIPHYQEALGYPVILTRVMTNLGLTRHAFERILFLVPVVLSGFLFGLRGTFIASLVALGCMLPRAILISQYPSDAIFETGAVFLVGGSVGGLIAFSFKLLRREREYLAQIEMAQQELKTSEERYRELFENAHDAIWLHDLEDHIIAANESLAKLTGYTLDELSGIKSSELFTGGCIDSVKETEDLPFRSGAMGNLSEVTLIKKNESEASIQLSTTPVLHNGQIVGFQHIARDVTEEKQLQENLRLYSQQATRAQEEERKRISRELHDDTIQALVVLSRQLDTLTSGSKRLTEENRLRLEELRQQTNDIIQGVRRLSQDLRPAALDRLGLLAALEWLASDLAEYSGIATQVNVLGSERRLTEEAELVLFRIVQEALRNVWRHSEATKADITLEFNQSNIKITISDNGKGFSPPKSMGDLAKDGRLGLAGMQERARLINGTLTLKSEQNKGTSVTIEATI